MKYSKIFRNESLRFGNKVYHRTYHPESFTQSKAEVKSDASKLRQKGLLARAVKRPDSWAVFTRRK